MNPIGQLAQAVRTLRTHNTSSNRKAVIAHADAYITHYTDNLDSDPVEPHDYWYEPTTEYTHGQAGYMWGITHTGGHALVDDNFDAETEEEAVQAIEDYLTTEIRHLVTTLNKLRGIQ